MLLPNKRVPHMDEHRVLDLHQAERLAQERVREPVAAALRAADRAELAPRLGLPAFAEAGRAEPLQQLRPLVRHAVVLERLFDQEGDADV